MRTRPVKTAASILALGTLWAAALWLWLSATEQAHSSVIGQTHWFIIGADGQYAIASQSTDPKKYIVRRTDTYVRTARIFGYPFAERFSGSWQWSGGPDGPGSTPGPPTEQQFQRAGQQMDELEGPPGFSHAKAAASGHNGYTQRVYHTSGILALLAASYLGAGPATWLFVTLTYRAVRRLKHSNRLDHGLCVACGYNLVDLKVDGPCPECGSSPAVSAGHAATRATRARN